MGTIQDKRFQSEAEPNSCASEIEFPRGSRQKKRGQTWKQSKLGSKLGSKHANLEANMQTPPGVKARHVDTMKGNIRISTATEGHPRAATRVIASN